MQKMSKLAFLFLSTALVGSLSLFGGKNEKPKNELKELYKIGNDVSKTLLKELGSNLKKQIKTNGILKAIDFCSKEAFLITNKVNQEIQKTYGDKISVYRISDKYRNPANKPQGSEREVFNGLLQMSNTGVIVPRGLLQQVDAETYKFYKPLTINKPVCLKCHGDAKTVPEDVQKYLNVNYPEDKAFGYKMQDLRGAIVVTIRK